MSTVNSRMDSHIFPIGEFNLHLKYENNMIIYSLQNAVNSFSLREEVFECLSQNITMPRFINTYKISIKWIINGHFIEIKHIKNKQSITMPIACLILLRELIDDIHMVIPAIIAEVEYTKFKQLHTVNASSDIILENTNGVIFISDSSDEDYDPLPHLIISSQDFI